MGIALFVAAHARSARADEPSPTSAATVPTTSSATAKPSTGPQFGYDPQRGAFIRTADGAWELNPYAMVQLQNVTLVESGKVASTSFNLKAAKLIFHGHIFHPSLTYHFQINAGDGKVAAEDIYLRWDPLPQVGLLVGQTEVPFNRQHITLEAYQELIDRSTVDARFNLQRDLGAAFYGADREHRFEGTLGVWNGSRANVPNDDKTYLGTLRLAYNPWGPIGFREADLDDSHHPKLSIAGAVAYNPTRSVPDPTGAKGPTLLHRIAQGVGEVTFRYRGLSLTSELHVRRFEKDDGKAKLDYGAFGQLGIFLIPKHLQLAGRFATLAGDIGAHDPYREITAGAAWYFNGHRLKVQSDYSHLEDKSRIVDNRVRFQIELFL